MAYRTTDAAVKGIIEVDSSISTTPFIEVANELVTEICVDDLSEDEEAYTATRLELIERWLAAHFYAIRDLRVASEGAGGVSQSFQYQVGLNLNVTIYGQQVLMLDTKGGFAALNQQAKDGDRKSVGITWLGKEDTTDTEDEVE